MSKIIDALKKVQSQRQQAVIRAEDFSRNYQASNTIFYWIIGTILIITLASNMFFTYKVFLYAKNIAVDKDAALVKLDKIEAVLVGNVKLVDTLTGQLQQTKSEFQQTNTALQQVNSELQQLNSQLQSVNQAQATLRSENEAHTALIENLVNDKDTLNLKIAELAANQVEQEKQLTDLKQAEYQKLADVQSGGVN